jgi:nucleoid-associated protein YgaU
MGRHARKRRLRWVLPAIALTAGLAGIWGVHDALSAPSSPVSHSTPLPTFTSDPSYPAAQRSSQPPVAPSASPVTHIVVSGDNLTQVALKYCHTADWMSVASRNHIGNPNAITPGEKIIC